MAKSVEMFRSPYENDNEWNLRKKFLEHNHYKFPTDRLVCLSMCYINHVSYGVTYSPGVMSQLKELSQGLPSHMDIVKEKNNIVFVKPKEKTNGCKYGNFVKSKDTSDNNTSSITKPTSSKYSNFVRSTEASFPKTFFEPGAGLGYKTGSTDNSKSCFSTNSKPSMNATKYPGFVKSESNASENSKPCFSTATESVTNLLKYPGFVKSVSNSPAENSKASANNNKYVKVAKPTPNLYVGKQASMPSDKFRSKPVVKSPQESAKPEVTTTLAKKTLLATPAATDSTSSSPESGNVEVTYLEKKFYALSDRLKGTKVSSASINAIQILNMAISKVKLLIKTDIMPSDYKTKGVFNCRVRIADVQVGEGTGSNKKTAKHDAFAKALNVLTKPTLKIQNQNGRQVLIGSNLPRPQLNKMTVLKSTSTPAAQNSSNPARKRPISSWGHFLIMENKLVNNAVFVIRRSADINKMPVEYVCWPDPQGTGTVCQLLINNEPIMECVGENKSAAKVAVSEKALQWLKERCWTIVVKQNADSDNIDVTRDEIMGEIEKQFKPIPSDNVGNQLLRKMGWEGGGIGAEGNKGIADPITVNQVIDRQGLGCRTSSGVSTKFDTLVRDVLLNYVKSKKQKDLVFTAEFSKDERAIIHKEARRFNLKSTSRGNSEDRHLIISRKRSAGQLFNHILASGGSTQKYELISPLKKTL